MNHEQEQTPMQALLTAYILGECSRDERAEVEKALESSPEWRTEHGRLAATIDLVKTAMAGADTTNLSAKARTVLTEAAMAEESAVAPRGIPSLMDFAKLAAAAVVLGFGVHFMNGGVMSPGAEGDLVARNEKGRDQGANTSMESTLEEVEHEVMQEPVMVAGAAASVPALAPEAVTSTPGPGAPAPASGPSTPGPGAPPSVARNAIGIGGGAGGIGGKFGGRSGGRARKMKLGGGSGAYLDPGDSVATMTLGIEPVLNDAEVSFDFFAYATADRIAVTGSAEAFDDALLWEAKESASDGADKNGLPLGGGREEGASHPESAAQGPDYRAMTEAWCGTLLQSCRLLEDEKPGDMFFRCWGDNPFEDTRLDSLSTFAVDVDTASYALARRTLRSGNLPDKTQIRTEEFLNYFRPDVPAPRSDVFVIDSVLAPKMASSDPLLWTLRVSLRGREVDKVDRASVALTFVVDVSGSMDEPDRLPLVKKALSMLLTELYPTDSVCIVAFNREGKVVVPMTSAANRGLIENEIIALQAQGGTSVEVGLMKGFEVAVQNLTPGANNRVVLLSDGVGNIGETDQARILASVEKQRAQGIYLNTVGVGMGDHNDAFLEQLANRGDGICNYVDDEKEVERALVRNFTGAFHSIARDVKIQVDFDPNQVASYRLLGYENRAIADAAFRDDKVDAGEVGAGHQVTALFELVATPQASFANAATPMATVRVRHKPPFPVDRASMSDAAKEAAEVATEITHAVNFAEGSYSFESAPLAFRRAVLVGRYAEFLRGSVHVRGESFDELLAAAKNLAPEIASTFGDQDFDEFCELLDLARPLIKDREQSGTEALRLAVDALRKAQYELGQGELVAEQLAPDAGAEGSGSAGRPTPEALEALRTTVTEAEASVTAAATAIADAALAARLSQPLDAPDTKAE